MDKRDNLEKAQLCVMNRKHQFIMRMAEIGHEYEVVQKFVELVDWDKEIEWAAMCFDYADAHNMVPPGMVVQQNTST